MMLFTETGERAKAMGVYGFVASGGGTIGVLAGGVLTDVLNWHWIFLVNIPIGVAVYALSMRLLPADNVTAGDRRVDIAGAVTVTVSLMLAVYAIVNGNESRLGDGANAGAAGIGRSSEPSSSSSPGLAPADAARAVQAPNSRDRERGRRPPGRLDVRVVLPHRALSPARAGYSPLQVGLRSCRRA